MATLAAFGRYLPSTVVDNETMSQQVGNPPEWILNVSGIAERRYANETLEEMAIAAGRDCLRALPAASLGMVMLASGSSPRGFPGPAAAVAHALGAENAVALDLPVASAGSLFGLALAAQLAPHYGDILVIAAEKLSPAMQHAQTEPGVRILFGDGAGACLVKAQGNGLRVVDSLLKSDGAYAGDLLMESAGPLRMNGRTVILQAGRRIPNVIEELLQKHSVPAASVRQFLLHQANQNLLDRVADALGVERSLVFSNIRRYGNTSSASLLIAAAEFLEQETMPSGERLVFGAFGAGFHWGALLAEQD
jgi:3-oxoacyl-[acyl-carrier-protein] synthase III